MSFGARLNGSRGHWRVATGKMGMRWSGKGKRGESGLWLCNAMLAL